jgi:hypothetical protein
MISCLWCGSSFEPRRGGSPQRFCGRECRTAFWTALRRWGDQAIADGVLTIAELKGVATACTLLQRGSAAPPDGPMRFIVEVEPTIVAGLVRIGFIRPDEREELGAIIAGMKHVGWAPYISRLA